MSDQTPSPYPRLSYPPYAAAKPGTNTLAIIALVGALLIPIAGVICGHIALSQIRRTGEAGRGLAITGLVIGYLYLAFIVLVAIGMLIALTATSQGYSAAG